MAKRDFTTGSNCTGKNGKGNFEDEVRKKLA